MGVAIPEGIKVIQVLSREFIPFRIVNSVFASTERLVLFRFGLGVVVFPSWLK